MSSLDPTELFRSDAPWFDTAPPEWLEAGESVAIYGAGGAGRDLARALRQRGVVVRTFVDRCPREASLDGVPVMALDDVRPSELPLLLGLHNPNVALAELIEGLRARGFFRIETFASVHRHLAVELGSRYFLASPESFLGARAKFERAANLFSDERSRVLFWEVLAYRMTGDPSFAPAPDTENQYFPADLPLPEAPLAFVDAGAYVGDTLEALSRQGRPVARAIAFEPDTANYRVLAARARDGAFDVGVLSLLPCAVAERTELLSFSDDGTAASHLDPGAPTKVLGVRLDEALAGYPVNFLKMDVEGAEGAALRGARETLRRDRPTLAISTYHLPLDHAEIPLLLEEILEPAGRNGSYHLRVHGEQTFDTVVYFVPDDRSRETGSSR